MGTFILWSLQAKLLGGLDPPFPQGSTPMIVRCIHTLQHNYPFEILYVGTRKHKPDLHSAYIHQRKADNN